MAVPTLYSGGTAFLFAYLTTFGQHNAYIESVVENRSVVFSYDEYRNYV